MSWRTAAASSRRSWYWKRQPRQPPVDHDNYTTTTNRRRGSGHARLDRGFGRHVPRDAARAACCASASEERAHLEGGGASEAARPRRPARQRAAADDGLGTATAKTHYGLPPDTWKPRRAAGEAARPRTTTSPAAARRPAPRRPADRSGVIRRAVPDEVGRHDQSKKDPWEFKKKKPKGAAAHAPTTAQPRPRLKPPPILRGAPDGRSQKNVVGVVHPPPPRFDPRYDDRRRRPRRRATTRRRPRTRASRRRAARSGAPSSTTSAPGRRAVRSPSPLAGAAYHPSLVFPHWPPHAPPIPKERSPVASARRAGPERGRDA